MRKPRLDSILIVLWGICLTISAYAYLTWLQPSKLYNLISQQLESSLGVQCTIEGLTLSLFPDLSVTIHDLSLGRGSVDNVEFHVRTACAEISWLSLLRLKPIVRNLVLDSPTCDISGQLVEKFWESPQIHEDPELLSESFKFLEIPSSIMGTEFSIHKGLCRFSSADGRNSLILSGIESHAKLPGIFHGNFEIFLSSIQYSLASGLDLTAHDTNLSMPTIKRKFSSIQLNDIKFSTTLQMSALDAVLGHEIDAPYRYFPLAKPAVLTLDASLDIDLEHRLYQGKGTTTAAATMTMNGHDVPMSLNIPFSFSNPDSPVQIHGADIRMENDRLMISGNVSGLSQKAPVLKGQAIIHHFSLARWFGFGQAMTKGLQKALDDITGSLDSFELSPHGVIAPQLHVKVLDMDFTGSGSCSDFLNPNILIDIHALQADLDTLFPELGGYEPDMSHLPPPVLPLSPPDESTQEQSSVGYDIHVMFDNVSILKFTPAGADIHVIPAPTSGTMLDIFVADLYKGNVASKVYLQDKVRVVANLKNVSMAEPTTVLADYPSLTSTLKQGNVDITFQAGDFSHVLSSLSGSVQASFTSGNMRFDVSKDPFAFQNFSIQAQAKASPPKNITDSPETMNYYGKWSMTLGTDIWQLEANAPNATIAFSTKNGLPAAMNKQNIQFKLELDKKISATWPQNIPLTGSTVLSFPPSQKQYELADTSISHPFFHVKGHATVKPNSNTSLISGQATISSSSVESAVATFGISHTKDYPFHTLNAETAFTLSDDSIKLSNITGKVDDISFTGTLSHAWQNRLHTDGSLHVSAIDLDEYLFSNEEKKTDSHTKLPLSFLREHDANLHLSIDRLRVFETSLTQVSLPIRQENGHLFIPAKANFPGGGQLSLNFSASLAQKGEQLHSTLAVNANSLNMLALSKERKQKTLLSGTGILNGTLTSQQVYVDDWKHTLGGALSLEITDGAIITPVTSANNAKKDSKTTFQKISMSTRIERAILTCKDFRLTDASTTIEGEGRINLANQTIDAKASILVNGILELPLTITGELMHPTTNYKVIGAVIETGGNTASTVIDILGSMLTMPFRIFSGNRKLVPASQQ